LDDKLASTRDATGSASARLVDELLDSIEDAADNQPRRSHIVSCDIGGLLVKVTQR